MDSSLQDDESYVNFLQDQVRRLNAVLKEYQKKYLPVKEPNIKLDEPLPPWLTNQSIISPLLVEYDETIKSLQDQMRFQKGELTSLKQRTDRVVEENTRLHEELRHSIETQMETMCKGEGSGIADVEKEMIDKMQYQLQLITQEKDSYIEMWENATRELEKLQDMDRERSCELRHKSKEIAALQSDLHKARRLAENLQVESKKMRMEHEKFLMTAQTQDQEIDNTRADLRKCKAELKASKAQADEYRNSLEGIKVQMRSQDSKKDDTKGQNKAADTRNEDLQTFILELESRLTAMIKEVGRLNTEKAELEERLETLQKRNADQEQREFEAIAHVRDSVQMVENAILERDQALVREQQKTQEANRLQEVIDKLLREAGKKTRDEVDSVRNQCNKNIQRLMEEMQYLEMEGAEKQAQLERAVREKSAVEKELEKVYREGPSEIERVGLTFEELQKRIGAAERTRDESAINCANLNATIKRMETKHEQEKAQALSENEELRRRIKQLEEECEEISENRLHLVEDIDRLKRNVLEAKQNRDRAEHERDTEVAALKKKIELKEKDFELKLRSVEEMNRQSINDLRDMLNSQQKIGIQWKEETKSLTQRFEKTVHELRQQVSAQKKRNDDLNQQLVDARHHSQQSEAKLSSCQKALDKLQKMAVDAETRADAASTQVSTLLNRERQLLHERKLLNRELERLKLEKSRPGNNNRIREPPQRLSDLLANPNAGASPYEPPVRLDLMSPRDERPLGDLDGFERRPMGQGYARNRVIL